MSSLVEPPKTGIPPSPAAATTSSSASSNGNPSVNCRLPDNLTLQNAVKWAILEDKPVMMDYWLDSLNKEVLIGVRENGEKILVRSTEEYTSPIVKIMKNGQDFIILTENSCYLVDAGIPVKRIS
jgi:hypothetical protein